MIVKDAQGLEIEIEISGDYDEAMIESGRYVDSGAEVPDCVLDELQDTYAAEISQQVYENMCGRAEAFYEGDR